MADGLTPEQEQERLRLIQEQNEAAKELLSTYEKQKKSKGSLNDSEKETLNIARDLSKLFSDLEKTTQKRLDQSTSSKDLAKELTKLEETHAATLKNSGEISNKLNQDKSNALSRISALNRAELIARARQNELESKAIELESQKEVARLAGNADEVKQLNRSIKDLDYQIKLKQKGIDAVVKQKEAQKDLAKQLDNTIKAQEGLLKQQEQEIELLKESVVQRRKKEALDVLAEKFRIKEIKDLLTITGLIKAIVDGAFAFNKNSVEISKNLGYGAGNANMMALEMEGIAASSNNVNVTMKSLGEAMGQLNSAMGGVAEYSADTLETQVMLTKQFGLTGEEAAGIYKFSVLTGKSSSQVNKEMVTAFANTRNMVKGSADFKTTMAAAAKVSGQLAATLQNNPALITKAIVQAQALGTTLEKTKSQGEKLLDFESSIEAELKAELLTGQQMNLERARAAALQGDQVTVMKELANQGMTLQKFQGMNVLAQKSFAEALGLSADELADQLNKQKIAQEQGKSLAQITADEALEAQKRQNVQDRFNAVMEKLIDIIGKIGVLLQPVFWLFEKITNNAWILYGVLGLIAASKFPMIAAGLGGISKQVFSLGKGIKGAFDEGGIKGFFGKVKEGFKSGFLGTKIDKSKEAAESGAEGAEKTSTTADKAKGDNAEGFKTRMKNIAEGIKAFADTKVLLGALNLIPASIGLVLFIPGALGAKVVEKVDGKKVEESLKGLAKGIKAFGDTAITGGAANLILASIGLVVMIPGVLGAKAIEKIDGKKVEESLKGLAKGIKAFGDTAVTGGSLNLILASVGLISMIPGALGAKAIEKIDGKKVEESLKGLAKGIKTSGDTSITGGALNLILASVGLIAMVPGVGGALLIQLIDSKKIKSSLEGLARGIEAFDDTKVLLGSSNLIFASVGLISMIPGVAGALLLQLVDGNRFKKSLSGIGEGISEFGKKAGVSDILKLMLGGPALLLFSAATPGLLLLQLVNGALIEKTLGGIGKGIAAFSKNVSWGDLIKAAVSIALLGASLIPASIAFKMFADVSWGDLAKAGVTLIGLGIAGSVLGGMAGELLMGALAIAALGASLIPAAFALQMFAEIKWEDLAKAGVALLGLGVAGAIFGSLMPLMLMGAVAIAALGASLIPFGIALNLMAPALEKFVPLIEAFGNVVTKVFSGIATVITAATNGIATIFTSLGSVDVTKLLLIGPALFGLAAGLASLGIAALIAAPGLMIMSLALKLISPSLEKIIPLAEIFGNTITKVFQGIATVVTAAAEGIATIFTSLGSVDATKLLLIGPALFGIGAGLAFLGGGGLIGSIASGIGKLFGGGGPIETLSKLAELGDPLKVAADSMKSIAEALTQISTALSGIDTAKLSALDEFASNRAEEESGGILGGITKLITAPIKAVGEVIGGGGGGKGETISPSVDLTPMIAAINEVKASVDKLYAKDSTINMDGKKVGTTLSQKSYKVA